MPTPSMLAQRSFASFQPSLSYSESSVGEDIVQTISNNRKIAMSAHHILGVKPLPRVGLFVH